MVTRCTDVRSEARGRDSSEAEGLFGNGGRAEVIGENQNKRRDETSGSGAFRPCAMSAQSFKAKTCATSRMLPIKKTESGSRLAGLIVPIENAAPISGVPCRTKTSSKRM